MGLSSNVCDAQNHCLTQLALERQVVLIGILGAEMGLKFAEQQHRPEICKINAARRPTGRETARCLRGLGNNRPERVGSISARLKFERQVKQSIREKAAAAERRLSTELFKHQLFDWIIEETVTHSDARFAWPSRQLSQPSFSRSRTPRKTDTWGECLVVG